MKMNKKKEINLISVCNGLCRMYSCAGEKSYLHRNISYGMTVPHRYGPKLYPLGNGRLGAMVYGTPGTEQIQLNEESIWAGRPNNNANPDALEYIPKVRELVFAGKYLEAQTLATEKVMAKTNSGMPYQSFGDLRICFPRTYPLF